MERTRPLRGSGSCRSRTSAVFMEHDLPWFGARFATEDRSISRRRRDRSRLGSMETPSMFTTDPGWGPAWRALPRMFLPWNVGEFARMFRGLPALLQLRVQVLQSLTMGPFFGLMLAIH